MAHFNKILIANRGEIALRILRACQELGISTVAVHSTADEDLMHVRLADERVCIGPAPGAKSYLNQHAILAAAEITGADAIHPGVGFLSETAEFARKIKEHGYTFIGPSPDMIDLMGDKVTAKQAAREAGIPVVPGSTGEVETLDEAKIIAEEVGYPVLIKAASGGGGRGMQIAKDADDLERALSMASTEAKNAFGNAAVYLEKYLANPRHIEVQILGDQQGNVVHLGERDCSLQRRHQKVFEEAPSPGLTVTEREHIGEVTRAACEKLGYFSAGTIEYLYEDGEFFFIEMNTRLQVEHPITEFITSIDLVRAQIAVAAGEPLSFKQEEIKFQGHSIECRLNAEDPFSFVPSPGTVTRYHQPGGPGVRIDSHLYQGYSISPHYDSLVAKLVVRANTRDECLTRLRRALSEYVIDGVKTSIPLHEWLLDQTSVQTGDYSIKWLEEVLEKL
ncbi:MAG: acetyl-CoA carboxylase biotin carboxylase subunit [Alphaproteobacteria bacterium]